jgi:hypothetical protein
MDVEEADEESDDQASKAAQRASHKPTKHLESEVAIGGKRPSETDKPPTAAKRSSSRSGQTGKQKKVK